MTTTAKIEANRRNAARSTGPRTAAGKALARYNAVRHGALTAAPLVPGEDVAAWDQHRQGVVASLAPAGRLEAALADRIALTLWRLDRVARYEAAAVDAAVTNAVLPKPGSWEAQMHPQPDPLDTAVATAKEVEGKAGLLKRSAERAGDIFAGLAGMPGDALIPAELAEAGVEAAHEVLLGYDHKGGAPHPTSTKFHAQLGVAKDADDWTADQVRAGFAAYAEFLGEPVEWMMTEVANDLAKAVDRRAAEWRAARARRVGLTERRRTEAVRRTADSLLPTEARADLVLRYEGHLQKLLTGTLHELERLQATRAGRDVPAPVVVDVTVTASDPGGG